MATWVTPIVGKQFPQNQAQDRLVRKIDANTVEVEVWKINKKGITIGSATVKMASDAAPFADFVRITGGTAEREKNEKKVRLLARQQNFVAIRAGIKDENGTGKKNGTSKGY